jgi:hypothetical protein
MGNIEMPTGPKSLDRERLRFHRSAETLVVPDWIKIIGAKDFRHCPGVRAVVVDKNSRLMEIRGFLDYPLHESIEVCAAVEVIERDSLARAAIGQRTLVHPVLIIAMNESYFR